MQMRKMKILYPVAFLVVLAAIVCSRLIVRHWDDVFLMLYRCPVIGILVIYNLSPKDYYVPVVSVPLKSGETVAPFSCKYAGRYEVDVVGFGGFSWEQYEMKIRVSVFDESGRVLYCHEQDRAKTLDSYTKDGKHYLRLCYGILNSPEELPFDRALFLKIDCSDGTAEFCKRNPLAKMILKKCFN